MTPTNFFDTAGKLQTSLSALRKGAISDEDSFEMATKTLLLFEHLGSELYEERRRGGAYSSRNERVEELAADLAQQVLYNIPTPATPGIYRSWLHEYRSIWRSEKALFDFCLLFFIASCLIGWGIGSTRTELVPGILPQEFIEMILNREAWFRSLQQDPLGGSLSIAYNNIRVSINCFIASLLFGIGGLLLLAYNGLFFGVIFGFCWTQGFHTELGDFVLSHGPLELSIIIAASFAGLLFGRVFFQRPVASFRERMKIAARRAFIVMLGILPWLIVAGLFEGFISPFQYFDSLTKGLVGLLLAATFWYWTLKPKFLQFANEVRSKP